MRADPLSSTIKERETTDVRSDDEDEDEVTANGNGSAVYGKED